MKRLTSFLAVLVIAAVNALVLFFVSALAAGGDGSADGVRMVWLYGYVWIGGFTLLASVLCLRNKGALGMSTAGATLPLGMVAAFASVLLSDFIGRTRPMSPALAAACRTAGAKYLAQPSTPVRSIAYDWAGPHAPDINYFTAEASGLITHSSGGSGPAWPAQIEFIESRCCRFMGRPDNGAGPFVRSVGQGGSIGAAAITADGLVTFQRAPLATLGLDSELTQYDLTVSDRRDGRKLATLRYFLDAGKDIGCATPDGGTMDERAFVLRAVGI